MRTIIPILLGLVLSAPVLADFDQGMAAYRARDYGTAFDHFYRAAVEGNETAQFNLGVMYYRGEGVDKDMSAAFAWIELSTQRGDAENIQGHEVLIMQMTPDEILAGHLLAGELASEFALYYNRPDYLEDEQLETELVVVDQ